MIMSIDHLIIAFFKLSTVLLLLNSVILKSFGLTHAIVKKALPSHVCSPTFLFCYGFCSSFFFSTEVSFTELDIFQDNSGVIGLLEAMKPCPVPVKIPLTEPVVKIASGTLYLILHLFCFIVLQDKLTHLLVLKQLNIQ